MKDRKVCAVAIIGRGIAGLCCAYRFAKAGFPVTVYGSTSSVACATKVATGMSSIKGNRLADQRLFRLKMRGHAQLRILLQEISEQAQLDLIHEGVHEPFSSLLEYQKIAEKVFRRQFRGLFQVEVRGDPGREETSFFYPNDFYFDPVAVLSALEELLKNKGVEFKEQQINRLSTGCKKGYVAIHFAESEVPPAEFQEVVLAAGHGAMELLASSGFFVHSLSKVWGETVTSVYDSNQLRPLGLTKLGTSGVRINGLCRTGASSLLAEKYTPHNEALARAKLRGQHEEFFGVAAESVKFQAGLRLRTKSREPLVGQVWLDPNGDHRLRLATAFYKNGFQFADLAACFHVSHVINAQYTNELFPLARQPLQFLT